MFPKLWPGTVLYVLGIDSPSLAIGSLPTSLIFAITCSQLQTSFAEYTKTVTAGHGSIACGRSKPFGCRAKCAS